MENNKILKYILMFTFSIIYILKYCFIININDYDFNNLYKDLISDLPNAISLTWLLYVIYEKFIWKFNPLESIPVLKKRYNVEINSSFDNKKYKGTAEVKQTKSKVQIKIKTKESQSVSIMSEIINDSGQLRLIYSYRNEPKINLRDSSKIHYGTTILYLNKNTDTLEGEYFTDRDTKGLIKFKLIS